MKGKKINYSNNILACFGILSLVFLIMLLIFYTLYRREIKVKTESTAKFWNGAFDSKNQLLISCLWWSNLSWGAKVPKDLTYAYFRETSSKSRHNVFDRTYVLGAGKNLDLRMIFQSGLYDSLYNPVDLQIGFVERYAGLVGFYKSE